MRRRAEWEELRRSLAEREWQRLERARQSQARTHGRSPELNQLYIDAVKAIHPVFARTPADRDRRTQTMAAANLAYQASDMQALRRTWEEYSAGTEEMPGEPTQIELDRLAEEISAAKVRIAEIERE